MYIKYIDNNTDYRLGKDDSVLMSRDEFMAGGKDLKNIAITVTPDGSEPIESEEMYEIQ